MTHDDVIKWKHFPRYWPSVRGIHRSPVKSPHKGQWRGSLMFSLISVWINGCVSNREACNLRRYRAHYDVIVMSYYHTSSVTLQTPVSMSFSFLSYRDEYLPEQIAIDDQTIIVARIRLVARCMSCHKLTNYTTLWIFFDEKKGSTRGPYS